MAYLSVTEAIDCRILPISLGFVLRSPNDSNQSAYQTEFDSGQIFNGVLVDDFQMFASNADNSVALNFHDLVLDANLMAIGGTLSDFWTSYSWQDQGEVQLIYLTDFSLSVAAIIDPDPGMATEQLMAALFAGDDTFDLSPGQDFAFGYAGHDLMNGMAGRDRLSGMAGRDTLNGGSGGDVLNGGRGDDDLTGGGGRDVFVFGLGGGRDLVLDFTEQDVFRVTSGAADFADLTATDQDFGTEISFGNVVVYLLGVEGATLDGTDFVFV